MALVGLRFIAYPEKRKVISVMLFRDGQPDAQKVIAEIQKTSDAIPFNMSMRDQEVTVVVAGQTFVMPVSKGTVKQISLSCFSAQFKFAAVELKESD
ncbi:MAG: hypothetical protein JWN59_1766 [Sphingomonas bacterium]|nr:hypothetical protein [Sphingomonas bacterium]MDB5683566.1 hypothetical protein [Sphingomonas bacterium]